MKLSILAAFLATATTTVRAAPAYLVARQNTPIPTPDQIAALAPDLGALPGVNPDGFGDCFGPTQADGTVPRVPCQCPPVHDAYVKAMTTNVLAGHAVNNTVVKISFPTGDSVNDKHGRITAAIITLQNLNGPGKGCPGVSTTLGIQAKNLDTCGDFFCNGGSPASSSSSTSTTNANAQVTTTTAAASRTTTTAAAPVADQNAAPSTVTVTVQEVVTQVITVTAGQGEPTPVQHVVSNNGNAQTSATTTSTAAAATGTVLSRQLVDQLAPALGSQPNNNPNKFGDCDGPKQPDGSIPRVPCQCPPTRDVFIDQLLANIEAGHAVHNPTVKLTFPTGNSKADQHARITAGTITLQNLNGPGQGCPNVSTTFAAQSNAIGN